MELNATQETTGSAATREPPSIFWIPKVHCSIHTNHLLVSSVSQTNSDHTTPSYFSKIHLIIHIPTPWSSSLFLLIWLSRQQPTWIPLLPMRATFSVHLTLLALTFLTILGEEHMLRAHLYAVLSNLLSLHLTEKIKTQLYIMLKLSHVTKSVHGVCYNGPSLIYRHIHKLWNVTNVAVSFTKELTTCFLGIFILTNYTK
jgi:hypothetical protein